MKSLRIFNKTNFTIFGYRLATFTTRIVKVKK